MDEEVILYDFCGTLVDFQTANAFAKYAAKKCGLRNNLWDYLRIVINRLRLLSTINRLYKRISVNKALLLYRLKGQNSNDLDQYAYEFYQEQIRPHFIQPVLEQMKKDISDGKTVVIISGGYDIYIQHFAKEFGVKNLICTELNFKNNIFTGHIKGKDCMAEEKLKRLQRFFPEISSSHRSASMTLYSDSDSDLPLFNICRHRKVVLGSPPIPSWAENIGAEIITTKQNI